MISIELICRLNELADSVRKLESYKKHQDFIIVAFDAIKQIEYIETMGKGNADDYCFIKLETIKNMLMDYLIVGELLNEPERIYVGEINITKCLKPYRKVQLRLILCKITSMIEFYTV